MQFLKMTRPFWPMLEKLIARWLAGVINERRSSVVAVPIAAPPRRLAAVEEPIPAEPEIESEDDEEYEEPSRGVDGFIWLAAGLSLGLFLGVLYIIRQNRTIDQILSSLNPKG